MEWLVESTEYLFIAVEGDVPTTAEIAFAAPGQRPQEQDWHGAEIVADASDPLWGGATSTGLRGDYYVALLVGPYGGSSVTVSVGDYQVWVRLTRDPERPVRIAPIALEVV